MLVAGATGTVVVSELYRSLTTPTSEKIAQNLRRFELK